MASARDTFSWQPLHTMSPTDSCTARTSASGAAAGAAARTENLPEAATAATSASVGAAPETRTPPERRSTWA